MAKSNIPFCNPDYQIYNEDKTDYNFSWTEISDNYVPTVRTKNIFSAFQYTSSIKLKSTPYSGDYNTYMGGGYLYQMEGSLGDIISNLTELQSVGWIDRQTRSIFIEFSLFNPNINLFSVSTILFEILPSGTILKSYR
jgi:polycystin 1L2